MRTLREIVLAVIIALCAVTAAQLMVQLVHSLSLGPPIRSGHPLAGAAAAVEQASQSRGNSFRHS